MRYLSALTGLLFVGILITACSEPTIVGSELLEDELTEVVFTDTLNLEFTATPGDSIITYNAGQQLGTYLCGRLEDPIFGFSSSEVFTQFRVFENAIGLLSSTIEDDGVVLRLRYDTAAMFGILDEEVTLEVYEMTEPAFYEESYYADHRFETSAEPIGSATFIPNVMDSVEVVIAGDTLLLPPHAAIPITDFSFRERLINADSATLLGIDSFQSIFRGLNIRMTSGTRTILAFRLSSGGTALQVEYTPLGQDDPRLYEFLIDPTLDVKTVHFENDYTGSFVEPYIGNTDLGEEYVFIQAMGGLDARLRILGLENIQDALINHAELILHEAVLPQDDTLFSNEPVQQIVTRVPLETGRLVNSRDVGFSLSLGTLNHFGGAYREPGEGNNGPGYYVMNTTAQLQAIIRGDAENEIYLSSYLKANNARRVVLHGQGHDTYPARLKLTLTKVQK